MRSKITTRALHRLGSSELVTLPHLQWFQQQQYFIYKYLEIQKRQLGLVYNNLFAYSDKKNQTQVLPTYVISSFELHINHIKQSIHIHVSIPVTITHVNNNRKMERKKGFLLTR